MLVEERAWLEQVAHACERTLCDLRARDEPSLDELTRDVEALRRRLQLELDAYAGEGADASKRGARPTG